MRSGGQKLHNPGDFPVTEGGVGTEVHQPVLPPDDPQGIPVVYPEPDPLDPPGGGVDGLGRFQIEPLEALEEGLLAGIQDKVPGSLLSECVGWYASVSSSQGGRHPRGVKNTGSEKPAVRCTAYLEISVQRTPYIRIFRMTSLFAFWNQRTASSVGRVRTERHLRPFPTVAIITFPPSVGLWVGQPWGLRISAARWISPSLKYQSADRKTNRFSHLTRK